MKFSQTVSYALQAILQLAEANSDAPVPCSRLAERGRMPERFLLQILRNLVTKGILRSTRGVDGGYTLVRSPDEITLLDLVEAIEGPLLPGDPVSETFAEPIRGKLDHLLAEVNGGIREKLQSVSITQFTQTG
ncbi:RrF2 family transcriptional regulator [Lignipirellula cremea]|uniref:HTH-type transcriptional regulator CymR n=1 Tax=Lignipirellula cremea TaxID=2528010 RepID=A0A518E3G9_9BACT|nr:Rrf2 family transcriptional regulator [Lignipirellula cremea]QDU98638.1 HTH-type transcriptional regulator CymR [Lignipirellula cremea]